MAQIDFEDYANNRIHLHLDTTVNGVDPAALQKEHRALRRGDANSERSYSPMVKFTGNNAIGGGRFTPPSVILAAGVRIVPHSSAHRLDILSQILNIADGLADRACFDRAAISFNVDIDPTYSPVEIREVQTGGITAANIAQISQAVWAETVREITGGGAAATVDNAAIAVAVWTHVERILTSGGGGAAVPTATGKLIL